MSRNSQVSGEGAGSSAAGGRRARARDMPQPQPASTRRDKRGMLKHTQTHIHS